MRTRLHACCLVLVLLLCVPTTHGAAEEHILRYDEIKGELQFSCPLESKMTDKKLIVANFGRYNQRTADGQVSRIAKWFNNSATKYEKGTVLDNTRRIGLTGFLTDVRCEDSQTYYCSYHFADLRGHIETRVENATFTFEGAPSVSIVKPQQTCHCTGDTMELKCRAHLGRQNNPIVWESKKPGGQFSADTSSKTNHSVPMDTKNCNYYSESTLTRDLTAADNERVWRCRLTYGDHKDEVIIAVDDSKEPCLKAPGESTTRRRPVDDNPRVQPSTDDKKSTLEGLNHSTVVTILATVIPISMLILIVIVALIFLKRHPKQLPPIVLLPDGPPPSEYSFSAVAGRGLPPLPQVQSNDYHFSAAREKSSEPLPPLPPYYQHKETLEQSVYVSMSAIPSSYETPSTSCNSAGMSDNGRLWEDSDDQGMRTERSESTYSNKEAIERAKTLAQVKAKNYNASFDDLDLLPLQLDTRE